MPSIKSNFSLKYDDCVKLQEKILEVGYKSENILNNYIHNQAAQQLVDAMTKEIPRSKRGKKHAKDNIWSEIENFNLATSISNSTKGKRGSSFYYLYYVVTGTGTSEERGSNDFLERGLNKEYPLLVNGIIEQLGNFFKEGLYE